jgi:predicted GH43/DUF377 family glycosyl hydrolase
MCAMRLLAAASLLFFLHVPLAAAEPAPGAEFPPELVSFVSAPQNPVFAAAGEGRWDARIRERGWVERDADGWHLWYTGYDGTRAGIKRLGYATSPDGIRWTRHPRNPIHDGDWVEDMMVVRDGDRWLMFAEGRDDQAQMLVSSDRVRWQRVGPLDVRRANGEPLEAGPLGTPTVLRHDGTWHLFYERRDAGVWLATSSDLKVWRNVQDEPVLSPGPDPYDARLIALNQVFRHAGRWYASYHGTGAESSAKRWCTCLAVSDDLKHWRKFPGNPLFPVEENKSSGVFVPDGRSFRLYTMHDRVDLHLPRRP